MRPLAASPLAASPLAPALVTLALVLAGCGDNVAGPGPEPTPTSVVALDVGEAQTTSAAEAPTLRIEGGAGGAEFTLIPFYGTTSVSAMVTVEFSGEQLSAVGGGASSPAAGELTAGLSIARASTDRDAAATFERRLRREAREQLTGRIPAARAAAAATRVAASGGPVPSVGAQLKINVAPTASCSDRSERTGRVMVVSDRAVVVADNGNPSGGFTDAEYAEIARDFDTHVHPLVTETFGEPADLDEDGGRVTLFFTRAVNELSPGAGRGIVLGYFNARDVLPATGDGACEASNEREILYVMVPDPLGVVNGARRPKDVVRRGVLGTLAHEYQHLVNASRRVHVNGSSVFEETWLDEGLSTIAEELMFYRMAGMSARANVTLEALLSTEARRAAFNDFQLGNFSRVIEHLRVPEAHSPFDNLDELATRGATWQFLRYAADRSETDERTLWRTIVNGKRAGVANFNAAFGADFITLVRDWATARYVDDAVPQTASMYQQPSWNYRSILPTLVPNRAFPLGTWALGSGAPLRLTLRAGGASYIRFGVAAGATGTVRVTSPAALPPEVSVTVVRTR